MKNINTDDLVVTTLQSVLTEHGLLSNIRSEWTGTMTELRQELVRSVGRTLARQLPQSPSALRVVLNRVINRIRSRGVTVKFARTSNYNRTRLVKFYG